MFIKIGYLGQSGSQKICRYLSQHLFAFFCIYDELDHTQLIVYWCNYYNGKHYSYVFTILKFPSQIIISIYHLTFTVVIHKAG